MAATTISRATITDDDGSGTTGTIINSAWVGTAVYDKVDALLTGATLQMEGSTDGGRQFTIVNASTGTAAEARILIGNSGSSTAASFGHFGTSYTTSGPYVQDGTIVAANRVGGLSVLASHASGPIRFYTGGTTKRAEIASSGHLILAELSADAGTSALAADAAVGIYTKNDKFVISYNNGGTETFITIPLDGSTTTWSHGTGAP